MLSPWFEQGFTVPGTWPAISRRPRCSREASAAHTPPTAVAGKTPQRARSRAAPPGRTALLLPTTPDRASPPYPGRSRRQRHGFHNVAEATGLALTNPELAVGVLPILPVGTRLIDIAPWMIQPCQQFHQCQGLVGAHRLISLRSPAIEHLLYRQGPDFRGRSHND